MSNELLKEQLEHAWNLAVSRFKGSEVVVEPMRMAFADGYMAGLAQLEAEKAELLMALILTNDGVDDIDRHSKNFTLIQKHAKK
jgi:hypothetical protein